MESIVVFDTETTSVDTKKAFCYDVGYRIISVDNGHWDIQLERHYVVEQVWHNLPLFESAYYADKRPLYVSKMKGKQAEMTKWGYLCRQMSFDFKKYNVTSAYAYNAAFDEKVFDFNCDWFKVINPFETTPIYDIWGYASQYITNTPDYQNWCENNNKFTESGNYSGSAETVYSYLINDPTYQEEHMGLPDSCIESYILAACVVNRNAPLCTEFPVVKVLKSNKPKSFIVRVDGNVIVHGMAIRKYTNNAKGIYSFDTK